MTNPTPHGQVPEALRLAEEITNLVCSSEAAAKTIAAAADELCRLHVENASLRAQQPASPPAEQQATKETSGGFHVWRDISTAPKDGSRFVATGHNYGLYSEVRHTCVAQWFRGCWMEASDWNETSELKYLTHWMPLPSPPDDVAAPGGGVVAAGRFMDEAAERRSAQEGYENRIKRVSERNPHDEGMYSLGGWDRAWKAAAPTPPAQTADSVLEDAARLDWLEQNLFHREKDEWDTKFGGYADYNMWVLFSPKGIHGRARDIIDAARKQGANHD